MATSGTAHDPQSERNRARWPSFILIAVLVAGMAIAAWQSAHRSTPDGPRTLTILAPTGASLTLDGATSQVPVEEGIHVFTVRPGQRTLQVEQQKGPGLEHILSVPMGIGPLMIELKADEGGQLQIGFY